MKRLLVFGMVLTLLTACGSKKAAFSDNGNPGQIKAVAYYDDNRNGKMDSGEAGAQVDVGISQDTSCPASSMDKITSLKTDTSGTATFENLKPGKYCFAPNGNYSVTTKLTQDVYVSSDMVTTVMLGVVRDQ